MINQNFIFKNALGQRCIYLKVSSKDALINMNKGKWWFRHPAYFQYEDIINGDTERGDCEDSLIKEKYFTTFFNAETIQTNLGSIPPQEMSATWQINREEDDIDKERILCFYRLDINDENKFVGIDERMHKFGDYFAFVNMEQLIDEIGILESSLLYFDMNYNKDHYSGVVGKSGKRIRYKHQNEFRMYLSDDKFLHQVTDSLYISELIRQRDEITPKLFNHPIKAILDADKEFKQIEKKLCRERAKYYFELCTSTSLVTHPISIREILSDGTIESL